MSISAEKRLKVLALLIGPLVTLAVTPQWNYDPINPAKVLVLASLSFACLGLVIPTYKILLERLGLLNLVVSALFIILLWSSFSFSGADQSQQFWGIFGRNTGILTYLALTATWIIFIFIRDEITYMKVFTSLVLTALLMTIYALVQLSGNDPVSWSYYAAFGTLGNVNFLSGFIGISAVAMFILGTSSKSSWRTRIALLLLCSLGIFVVAETDSIQGIIAFAAGVGFYGLLLTLRKGPKLYLPYAALSLLVSLATTAALFNKGPFAGFIYQVTIVYRADYMGAGLRMMRDNPFFGVGIDSYDDWYRAERGAISAFRTGLSRTANTAHNIALDLGAGGGVFLFLVYLAFILIAIVSILLGIKKGLIRSNLFCLASSTWIAYQVQAAVSINQVGLGVWGWVISGVLVGYVRQKTKASEIENSRIKVTAHHAQVNYDFFAEAVSLFRFEKFSSRHKKSLPNTPPPAVVLLSVFLFGLGFVLSFIPMRMDMEFRRALNSSDATKIQATIENPASQAFHISQAASLALSSNLSDQGKQFNQLLLDRFPRNYFGLIQRLYNPVFSAAESAEARKELKGVDPFASMCLDAPMPDRIVDFLGTLPLDKQLELLDGWGLGATFPNETFRSSNPRLQSAIKERIIGMCR